MFDCARIVALLFALAGCWRPRYVTGALAGLALTALMGWEIVSPLVRHVTDGGPGSAFALVFLGPSRLATSTYLTLADAVLASGASSLAFAHARPLRPEGERARAWDAAGLRFLLVAVLSGVLIVFDLLLAALMRDP